MLNGFDNKIMTPMPELIKYEFTSKMIIVTYATNKGSWLPGICATSDI
jgi:hypothetical protein